MFSQIIGVCAGFLSSYAFGRVLKLVFDKLITEEEGRKLITRIGIGAIAAVAGSAIGTAVQNGVTDIIELADNAVKTIKLSFHIKESK